MGKYHQPYPLVTQSKSSQNILTLITVLSVALVGLVGCGQKGDLYLPESSQPSSQTLPNSVNDPNSPALPITESVPTNTIDPKANMAVPTQDSHNY